MRAANSALDPAPFQLGQEFTQPVGEDCDLDLLEDDADDARAVACLEEERPVARLADGAGHETLGWVEEIAASRHVLTLYRFEVRPSEVLGPDK
jgi:hypothetical protein